MTTPQRRSVRLNRIQEFLRAQPGGYTARELARLTGVTPRSIQRDLLLLQSEAGVPLTENAGRYGILEPERLSPMRLNLQEARALLLATRLFLRYSDEGDPFAASAIGQHWNAIGTVLVASSNGGMVESPVARMTSGIPAASLTSGGAAVNCRQDAAGASGDTAARMRVSEAACRREYHPAIERPYSPFSARAS